MGCLSGAQAQPPGVGVAWEKFGEGGKIRLRRGNRPSPVSAVFSNETTAILGGGRGGVGSTCLLSWQSSRIFLNVQVKLGTVGRLCLDIYLVFWLLASRKLTVLRVSSRPRLGVLQSSSLNSAINYLEDLNSVTWSLGASILASCISFQGLYNK